LKLLFKKFLKIELLTFKKEKAMYRAFREFGQAKFAYGDSILGSSQFTLLPQLLLKNDAQFKSGQN